MKKFLLGTVGLVAFGMAAPATATVEGLFDFFFGAQKHQGRQPPQQGQFLLRSVRTEPAAA